MRILKVAYSVWEAVVDGNGFAVFHIDAGPAPTSQSYDDRRRVPFAGNADLVYTTEIHEADFGNGTDDGKYEHKYGTTATLVVDQAEAVALIEGIHRKPPSPREADGKQVFVASPATEGWMTWVTSRGDDLTGNKRGDGQLIKVAFTEAGDSQIDLEYLEPVELHDGELNWDPAQWGVDDEFSFSAVIPASVPTSTPGVGNCNKVDVGGYNILVPAAGDGDWTIDLGVTQPVVPTSKSTQNGYWDVNLDTGIVSPSGDVGKASWHLLDVPVESFFMKRIAMGNPRGVFEIDVYKAEWVSPKWKMRLAVKRVTSGAGTVGGWLMLFREKST